jgi:hypothetical protein
MKGFAVTLLLLVSIAGMAQAQLTAPHAAAIAKWQARKRKRSDRTRNSANTLFGAAANEAAMRCTTAWGDATDDRLCAGGVSRQPVLNQLGRMTQVPGRMTEVRDFAEILLVELTRIERATS